jgi:Xaa-Pro dipeptidase
MQQPAQVSAATYDSRIDKARRAMRESGLRAIVLESGAAMLHLTGVRWGRSERTFAFVLPTDGDVAWIVPGFEVMRARELIRPGADIRAWEEDESPFEKIAQALRDRGVVSGRVGIDDNLRFFVFDGIRAQAAKLELVSAAAIIRAAGA